MTGDDDDFPPEPYTPRQEDGEAVDAGSPEGRKRAERDLRRRRKREAEFIARLLGDRDGRAFVWSLLEEGGAFQTPFACGPNGFPQPEATWFKAGQQALALGLYHRLLATDFAGVHLMLSEFDGRFKKASK